MMRQIYGLEELEGKKVHTSDFGQDGSLIVVFKDETFLFVSVVGGEHSLEIDDDFNMFAFGRKETALLGIMSREEIDKALTEEEEERAGWIEKRDRAEWERLKKKYGG